MTPDAKSHIEVVLKKRYDDPVLKKIHYIEGALKSIITGIPLYGNVAENV